MKKLLTLLLAVAGYVGTVNATDYYVGAEISSSWSIKGQMTDTDGDGTYSLIVDLPQANMYFTLWTANEINWQNNTVLRPSTSSPWITNTVHEITMLEPGDDGYADNGSICYPVADTNDDNKNFARAIRIDYTPSSKTLAVTRLIVVASGYNGWSTTTDYIEETSCGSKIYKGKVKLEADTNSKDDGFKFVYTNAYYEGSTLKVNVDWGANNNGSLSNSASNFDVATDGVYDLTANFTDWKWVEPELVTVPASVGTYGMATLSSEYDLDFTGITDIHAYTITSANKSTGELTKTDVTGKVPANTGLYIEGAANASVNVPTTVNANAVNGNMLVAATAETNIAQTAGDKTNYILTVNAASGEVATPKFFKVNDAGNTVLAGKAYLQIPTADAARMSFWFADEATGIDAVKEQTIDGQAYNLAGQRVAQPTKGLYIVNGKKVIKK